MVESRLTLVGGALDILFNHTAQWIPQAQQHLVLSVVALLLSIGIGVPIGAWLTRRESIAFTVVSIANLGRTIPSLAVLALAYPFVGTGFVPSIIALVAMGVPPILLGTYTGVREVDPSVRDAAEGIGLSSIERLIQAELPIAAPIVLSGIRTSAVQIVASATLAALIGGGGLGEMILAGLTNMRFDLLIAGSMLVGILAVATEIGFAKVEKHALPLGIRLLSGSALSDEETYKASAGIDHRRWLAIGATVLAGVGAFSMAGTGAARVVDSIHGTASRGAHGEPQVTIGSKDFTEQVVIGELYAQALEAKGFPVKRRLNLGATAVADAALEKGQIDLYPEYTGTALLAVLKGHVPRAAGGGSAKMLDESSTTTPEDPVYTAVERGYKKRGMKLLAQTPFSNGNAIVVTSKTAKKFHLKSISDLAKHSNDLNFGAVPGFDTREDGLPLLKKAYHLEFGSVKTYEIGLKYKALNDGKIDAVYGFETDGQIAHDHLVALRDDRSIWPPYHAVPIVNTKFAAGAGTKFAKTLDAVTKLLDSKTMQKLNSEVDQSKKDPEAVAHAFLLKHKLA